MTETKPILLDVEAELAKIDERIVYENERRDAAMYVKLGKDDALIIARDALAVLLSAQQRLDQAVEHLQELVTDVENGWHDPHTLRHARAFLSSLKEDRRNG